MRKERYDQILAETLETMEMMEDQDLALWIADLVWQLERIANLTRPFLEGDQGNGKA